MGELILGVDFRARREREAAEMQAIEITNVALMCEQFPAIDTAPSELNPRDSA